MVEKWLETGYVGWKKRKESRLELRDDERALHARVSRALCTRVHCTRMRQKKFAFAYAGIRTLDRGDEMQEFIR